MKKLLVIVFGCIALQVSASSVIFYNTYSDFKNKKGTDKGEFKELVLAGGRHSLLVIDKNGKKVTYANKELGAQWGFELESVVYRLVPGLSYGALLELIHLGEKVSLYQDATPRINAANDGKPYSPESTPAPLFFTIGPDGKMNLLQATLKKKIKDSQKEEFPQLGTVFSCLESSMSNNYTQQKGIQCFIEFDKK